MRMRVRLLVNNVLQKIKQSTLVNILFFRWEFSHSLGRKLPINNKNIANEFQI